MVISRKLLRVEEELVTTDTHLACIQLGKKIIVDMITDLKF